MDPVEKEHLRGSEGRERERDGPRRRP